MVNNYVSATTGAGSPGGTTLNWRENNSTAVLSLPAGSTVLYAELIWGGSAGFYCQDAKVGVDPNCILQFTTPVNGAVKFTTPDGVTHAVAPDPATALISIDPAPNPALDLCGVYYTCSQDVTALLSTLAAHNGTYACGGVPATVYPLNNTQNAAGWTLAIMYANPAVPEINNLSLFISNQQGTTGNTPAVVSGFCAAPAGTLGPKARVLVSAIEGDANKCEDHMLFGITPVLTYPTNALSGPNNPINNFFCSQINDDNGNLVTSGTYGTLNGVVGGLTGSNSNPFVACPPTNNNALCYQGRQGWDITNVDASALIVPNAMTAYALATSTSDDYTVNALGIQISVVAPVILPMKLVNGQTNITSNVGDTVTFTVEVDNTGHGAATNVVFQDTLQAGLVLNPSSVTVDSGSGPVVVPITQAALASPGLSLINPFPAGAMVTIAYTATIVSPPVSGNVFLNQGSTTFDFNPCSATEPIPFSNTSNIVSITLPLPPPPTPTDPSNFVGAIKKCKFLNKTMLSLRATFDPAPSPLVLFYRIFENGVLVATVPAVGPYVFETCLRSKSEASEFTVVAVYPGDVQSAPINIRIVNE